MPTQSVALGIRSASFRLLLLGSLGSFSGFGLLLPAVPLRALNTGSGEVGAGLTTAALMLTTVAAQLLMPRLIARLGYRWTLGLGSLLLGLPAPLYALSSATEALVGVSAVRGLGFGLITVAGSALAVELVPGGQRGRATALYGVAVGVPQLFCLPGGVWAVESLGSLTLFLIGGLLPVMAVVPIAFIRSVAYDAIPRERATADPAGAGQAMSWVRTVRLLGVPWLVMVAGAIAFGGLVTFFPASVAPRTSVATAVLFALPLAMITGRWVSGVATDRAVGNTPLLTVGVGVAASGLAAITVASARPDAFTSAVLGGVLFGLGFGAVQNQTLVLMFGRAGRSGVQWASAAWNIAYDAGTGIGALLLGTVVAYQGYAGAFGLTAIVVLLSGVLTANRSFRRAS